jgi:plastocyanin
MIRPGWTGKWGLAPLAGLLTILAACGGGGGGGGGLDNADRVSELEIQGVSGSTLDLNVGASTAVAVEAFDATGNEIEDAPITASSSNTSVATVVEGLSTSRVRLATVDFTIRGVGAGDASITFRHEASSTTKELPVHVVPPPPPGPPPAPPGPPPPPPPPPAARTVMTGNGNQTFSPASISITRGTRVDWIWSDPATHTVTSDPGQADSWDSGFRGGTGTQFSHTFNTAGTFSYTCLVHAPNMAGTVMVTP